MKRIIVLSDSHGNAKGVSELMPLIAENDLEDEDKVDEEYQI